VQRSLRFVRTLLGRLCPLRCFHCLLLGSLRNFLCLTGTLQGVSCAGLLLLQRLLSIIQITPWALLELPQRCFCIQGALLKLFGFLLRSNRSGIEVHHWPLWF